jgi:hypothetical protein
MKPRLKIFGSGRKHSKLMTTLTYKMTLSSGLKELSLKLRRK